MYKTIKYNNQHHHILNTFARLADAIASAKALHHPDWPVNQGIKVTDDDGDTLFDSANHSD